MEPRASSVAAVAAAALVLAAGAHAQARLVTAGYPYASSCPQAGDRDDVDRWKMNTCNCTSYAAWALWRNGYRTDWFVAGSMDAWNWPNVARRHGIPSGSAARVGAVAVGRRGGRSATSPSSPQCTATAPSTWRSTTCPADVRSSRSTGARPSRRAGSRSSTCRAGVLLTRHLDPGDLVPSRSTLRIAFAAALARSPPSMVTATASLEATTTRSRWTGRRAGTREDRLERDEQDIQDEERPDEPRSSRPRSDASRSTW